MKQKIRWGILGCARIARRGLIPGIQGSQLGSLEAIASRDGAKAQAWATEFGIPRPYASYEDLLNDPDLDAVYVPLPNELHLPWTRAAAAAGKHVLCDKPLAINSQQAELMVHECERHNVLLMEGFMWRHHPRTLAVEELVHNGAIGKLRLIRAAFSFDIDRDDWRLDAGRGGGALWDVGCYGVNTCRLFCSAEPLAVFARAHWWSTGVDMTLAAVLQFPEDVIAMIDCSFESPFRCCYELVGTKGTIEVPNAYLPDESPYFWLRRNGKPERVDTAAANQYSRMVDAFSNVIRDRRGLEGHAENGLANMRVLDSLLAASRVG